MERCPRDARPEGPGRFPTSAGWFDPPARGWIMGRALSAGGRPGRRGARSTSIDRVRGSRRFRSRSMLFLHQPRGLIPVRAPSHRDGQAPVESKEVCDRLVRDLTEEQLLTEVGSRLTSGLMQIGHRRAPDRPFDPLDPAKDRSEHLMVRIPRLRTNSGKSEGLVPGRSTYAGKALIQAEDDRDGSSSSSGHVLPDPGVRSPHCTRSTCAVVCLGSLAISVVFCFRYLGRITRSPASA